MFSARIKDDSMSKFLPFCPLLSGGAVYDEYHAICYTTSMQRTRIVVRHNASYGCKEQNSGTVFKQLSQAVSQDEPMRNTWVRSATTPHGIANSRRTDLQYKNAE